MFEELHALLDDSRDRSTSSILLTSFDFDSNFLLQHFLSSALKNSFNCVYISFLTSFTHLKHVQGKMGNVLKTPEFTPGSNLIFIPFFSSISEQFFTEKSVITVDQFCTIIQKQTLASPRLILIEDLQILRHILKYSDADILLLLRKLRQLYPDTQFITQISLSDDEHEEDNYSSYLINMLQRIHDKHLFVRSLSTGATKDISGQVPFSFQRFFTFRFFIDLVSLFRSIASSSLDEYHHS